MSGSPNKTICFITEQLNQMKLKRDDVKAPDYRTVTVNILDIICFFIMDRSKSVFAGQ